MKKLYALLVILIVIYVGINVGANGLNILNSNSVDVTTNTNTADGITVGASSFPKIANFTDTKINDTAVKLADNKNNVTIEVDELDSSKSVSDIYKNLNGEGSGYTSSQEIDQNGVTAYFLYKEGDESYNADIYFSKDNHNYKISGTNITYENSDYFINHCKNIIDTIKANG